MSFSLNTNECITATDISQLQTTIKQRVEENVTHYTKQLLSKKVRKFLAAKRQEVPDYQLNVEDKNRFKAEIENSEEIAQYREFQTELLSKKSSNYQYMREVFSSFNNELSDIQTLVEIEKAELQNPFEFKSPENYLKLLYNVSSVINLHLRRKRELINNRLQLISDNTEYTNINETETYRTLKKMYGIDKSYSDIDLYDEFELQSNIDFSSHLGEYYAYQAKGQSNATRNIINEWYRNSSENHNLSKFVIINNYLFSQLLMSVDKLNCSGDSDEFEDDEDLSQYQSELNRYPLITNNRITCYKSMYTTTDNNKYTFVTRTIGELLMDITNPDLSSISKEDRQQIYSVYDGSRPQSNEYWKWNGLQVFDLDLKPYFADNPDVSVEQIKRYIFEELREYHWFLWVARSASGKGIHIYTKVTPPHHVFTDLPKNENMCKYWFLMNYLTKSILINHKLCGFKHFTNQDFIENKQLKYFDNVVSRITAGIRLTFDKNILVNPEFMDLHVSEVSANYKDYQTIQNYLFETNPTKFETQILSYIKELTDVDQSSIIGTKLIPKNLKYETIEEYENIKILPREAINYNTRYHICNTLAALFGKEGLQIAHTVLQSEVCKNVKEINSFYTCAISNKKEPSKYGLQLLQKLGIIKNVQVQTQVENETTTIEQYTSNLFKDGIRKAIEASIQNERDLNAERQLVTKYQQTDDSTIRSVIDNNISRYDKTHSELNEHIHELSENQYLADLTDILLDPERGGFTNDKINILISPAGSGKTRLLLELAKQGKRILLVEPFISVIKNKVESDEELMKIFETFYGEHSLNDITASNAITTFDKFSKCNYEKVSKMFDYICIDESHLLFTSAYRIEATSNAIRKLKELYFISNNDPFAGKLILMTGTETGDTHFFGKIANVIRVTKPAHDKHMEFLVCDDSLDAITRLSYKTFKLISEGYRIMIPTNKGEIYSQKLIGMVEYLLQRPVKYGYYKRSNSEQEICRLINEQNTIGDYEIIFCSNYLSVGVDIVDKYKFASIYFGPFTGYEIEQFNARIRKTGIRSIYCIQTETASGDVNELLLEEPRICLKLNDDDISNFKDDKCLATAKQEFIAEYDPVLHRITTPGFSYLNGAIRFNKEEYELTMFELKYLETMIHPTRVARELFKYQYTITVSPEYDGLDEIMQNQLKQIGIEAARNEKIRKHNLLVGTFISLIDNNTYTTNEGLEFNNIIDYIGKHRDIIEEDRSIDECIIYEFNIFGQPEKVIVKSLEAFEKMFNSARYLISKYSVTRAKQLIQNYVDENGILKQKGFMRAINLLRLIDKSNTNDLSEPIFKTIEKMYIWLDEFEKDKSLRVSYNTYQSELDSWINSYIDMLGIKISTIYAYNKIKDNMVELLNDLATRNTSKNGMRFEYNVLPDTDSVFVKYKQTIDSLIENTFSVSMGTSGVGQSQVNRKHMSVKSVGF